MIAIRWRGVLFFLLFLLVPLDQVSAGGDSQSGIHFDGASQTWYFYGVVGETVQYEIPGGMLDLAQVHYIQNGASRTVWVALGIQTLDGYLPRGPWNGSAHARQWIRRGMPVRVFIEGNAVSETGIDWNKCETLACRYAHAFDQMHMDLSNRIIRGEAAPGWYPWGFLFWEIDLLQGEDGISAISQYVGFQ